MFVHHLGLACVSIEEGLAHLRAVYDGVTPGEAVYDERQDATVCLVETANGVTLELVAGAAVAGVLKRGGGLYHVCYEVADLAVALERLQAAGGVVVAEPKPARLFGGRPVAFVHTRSGLLELLERAPGTGG